MPAPMLSARRILPLAAMLVASWCWGIGWGATLSAPQAQIHVGESLMVTYHPGYSMGGAQNKASSYVWSNLSGSSGAVQFFDSYSSDPCNPYGSTVTDPMGGCGTSILIRGTKVGTTTIQCVGAGAPTTCDSFGSGGSSTESPYLAITVLPPNSGRPPDKMPLGAKFTRVDAHGVPMPDASPTGESESDRIANMAYTDMYDLSPKYSVTDMSVPVDGGELTLEFRRTMGIQSRNYNADASTWNITYPTENLMGLGWDVNLGARILLVQEQASGGVTYQAAHVVDEVGNTTNYIASGLVSYTTSSGGAGYTAGGSATFAPDVTHTFNNESLKSRLTFNGTNLLLTKTNGTVVAFEHVTTFFAPFMVASSCSNPSLVHTEDYWRLASVTDRNGNKLVYDYYTDGMSTPHGDLVAKKITFINNGHPEDTQRFLTITATRHSAFDENTAFYGSSGKDTGHDSGWRIDSVTDPLGRTMTYTYTGNVQPFGTANALPGLLTQVTRPAVENPAAPTGPAVAPTVQFTYYINDLPDIQIGAAVTTASPGVNRFVAPQTITDANGNPTTMVYRNTWFPTAVYASLGSSVWQQRLQLLSMQTVDGTALFSDVVPRTAASVTTKATDTRGKEVTYTFTSSLLTVPNSVGGAVAVTKMTRVTDPTGLAATATFEWQGLKADGTVPALDSDRVPDVNNNLSKVTDISGNIIYYDYSSGTGTEFDAKVNPAAAYDAYANPHLFQLFNKVAKRRVDPTGLNLITQYRYDSAHCNKQSYEVDAQGITTHFLFDAFSNRTDVIGAEGNATVQIQTHYAYDADGFVNLVTDGYGTGFARTTTMARTFSAGTPTAYTSTTSKVVGFSATPLNLTTVTVADVMGSEMSVTDPRSNVTTFVYDNLNRRTSMTQPVVAILGGGTSASTSQTHYDLNGNVIRTVDDEGNVTTTSYDGMNRPVVVRRRMLSPTADDASDLVTTTDYSNSMSDPHSVGLARFTVDANGRHTDFEYDVLLRLTKKTLPTVTLPGGSTIRYTELSDYSGGNAGSGAFAYWSGWQPTRTTDQRGNVTDTTYDDIYRPTRIVRRLSAATAHSAAPAAGEPYEDRFYNPVHQLIKQVTYAEDFSGAAANHVTFTAYDALHRKTMSIVDPDGSVTSDPPQPIDNGFSGPYTPPGANTMTTVYAYDPHGNVTYVRDPAASQTANTYDGANRLTKILQTGVPLVDPVGYNSGTSITPTTLYTYDAAGNRTLVEDPNHTKSQSTYDARNRLTQTVLDLNNDGTYSATFNGADIVSQTVYNLVGKVVQITDSRGNATTTAYDRAYRVITLTQPAVADAENSLTMTQPVIQTRYDFNGNVTGIMDARSVLMTTAYDELNRARTVVQASGTADAVTTETQYDAANNVSALLLYNTGSGGTQTTTYQYDAFNRKTAEILPQPDANVRQTLWTYYRNGAVRTVTDPKLQVQESEYDRAGRQVTLRSRPSAAAPPEETRTFTYSLLSKVNSAVDLTGTSFYTYDRLFRLGQEQRNPIGQSNGVTKPSYDAASNRTQVAYPSGTRTVVNRYDRGGRLTSVTDGANVTSYTYDVNGNCLTRTDANGEVTTSTFDALNRLLTTSTALSGVTASSSVFTFDLVGNRRTLVENLSGQPARTVTYTYDQQYRLTGESYSGFTQTYTYDPAGNRLTTVLNTVTSSSTYNLLNQLLTGPSIAGAATFTYDLNGNLTQAAAAGGKADNLTWDTFNRLKQVQWVNGASNAVSFTATYDHRGRRQFRMANPLSTGSSPNRYYRYLEGVTVEERESSGTKVEFVRAHDLGGGIGGVLYSDRSMAGGIVETFAYNGSVGDVTALTNASGTVTATDRYDAFGNLVTTTGSTSNNRLANTKERDFFFTSVLGNIDYHGMRYYSPFIGRYLSQDPLGYPNGLNNYLYVNGNPINRIDPVGLWIINRSSGSATAEKGDTVYGLWSKLGGSKGTGMALKDFQQHILDLNKGLAFKNIQIGSEIHFEAVTTATGEHNGGGDAAKGADERPEGTPAVGGGIGVAELARNALAAAQGRELYNEMLKNLAPDDNEGRARLKDFVRTLKPQEVNDAITKIRPSTGARPGSTGSANKSNPAVNALFKRMGMYGKFLGPAGLVVAAAGVAAADDKARAAVEVGGGMAGAWAGFKLGALGGTLCEPGGGTVIGAVVGAIGGGMLGSKAGGDGYDLAHGR